MIDLCFEQNNLCKTRCRVSCHPGLRVCWVGSPCRSSTTGLDFGSVEMVSQRGEGRRLVRE